MSSASYSLVLRNLGAELRGVNLLEPVSREAAERIKKDVSRHRLLLLRDQGVVSGERQVEISRWFGELESTFYRHPRSPHPDVFRVSNSEREGCRNVGRTGWHIDGSFMPEPFSFSLYHIVSAPQRGDTAFVPLKELVDSLSPKKRAKWERLWMVSDGQAAVIHPLIYPHPVTREALAGHSPQYKAAKRHLVLLGEVSSHVTMCFHLGMTGGFVWDFGTEDEKFTSRLETSEILQDIHNEIVKDGRRLIYSHKWEAGDFIFSDNLALGHEAAPETQFPVSEVGLRVMHRTTVRGRHAPSKVYPD